MMDGSSPTPRRRGRRVATLIGAGRGTNLLAAPFLPRFHAVGRVFVSVLGWIILGLISGFIASKVVNRTGEGFLLDILLGIVGAIVGGFLFVHAGAAGITGFNPYSMFVAIIGAIIVLVLYHALFARRRVW